jgi:hypothetical protein
VVPLVVDRGFQNDNELMSDLRQLILDHRPTLEQIAAPAPDRPLADPAAAPLLAAVAPRPPERDEVLSPEPDALLLRVPVAAGPPDVAAASSPVRPKRAAPASSPLSDSSSSRSHSASGSSSAGLAETAPPSLSAASDAYTLRSRSPSATASATILVSRLPARMASSLPGIG